MGSGRRLSWPRFIPRFRVQVVPDIVENSIAVDAACSGNPGIVEYQGFTHSTGTPIFHKKIDGLGTNNIGEFLALVHALAWQDTRGALISPFIQIPMWPLGGSKRDMQDNIG